jgi:hypothetical protein
MRWLTGASDRTEPVRFALLGPLAVCGIWAMTPGGMVEAVALSTVVSSVCYLPLLFGNAGIGPLSPTPERGCVGMVQ